MSETKLNPSDVGFEQSEPKPDPRSIAPVMVANILKQTEHGKRPVYCFVIQMNNEKPFQSMGFETYGDAARQLAKVMKA